MHTEVRYARGSGTTLPAGAESLHLVDEGGRGDGLQRNLSVVKDILRRARDENIALVGFLYADHGGIIRGKAVGASRLEERVESGIGHSTVMMAVSMVDRPSVIEGMGRIGEVRIKPDISTFTPPPYAPGAAAMLADQVNPDGTPWDGCARTFLKQAVAELADEGYEPVSTWHTTIRSTWWMRCINAA